MDTIKKLSGKALSDHLISHPEAVTEEVLKTLDKEAWTRLLLAAPQWGKFCPWQKLNSVCWVRLLKQQVQFAEFCDWSKFTSPSWGSLLRYQTQFADRCPWQSLDPFDFAYILQKQPQLADRAPEKLQRLPINGWITLLQNQPSFIEQSPYHKFSSEDWGALLFQRPKLEKYCPWDKLYIQKDVPMWWNDIFYKYPEWAEKVSFRMDEELLFNFLYHHPQYIDRIDPEKLSYQSKKSLFIEHGILEKYCHFGSLSGNDWSELLKKYPQYASMCRWDKLSGTNWTGLLSKQPQFHIHCDWSKLDNRNCFYLVKKRVEFLPKLITEHFSSSENHDIWENVWNQQEKGIDSLYKLLFNFTEVNVPKAKNVFEQFTECDSAAFLIYRNFDETQAKHYFRRELKNKNWKFIEEVYDLAPEITDKLVGKNHLPFLLTMLGVDSLLTKYLAVNNAASYRDQNGNTLLHAALLAALYAGMESIFQPDNPYRKRYDFLVAKGCSPDVKNNAGFSCSDLLKILKENIELYTEIINSYNKDI